MLNPPTSMPPLSHNSLMSSNTKQSGYNASKNNRSYKNPRQQPCRGFPAIFFTCESGREKKCQREALELIHHYYYLAKSGPHEACGDKDDVNKDEKKNTDGELLSLDEELKLLRRGAAAEEVLNYERNPKRPRYEAKGAKSMKSPFVVHDVGMKGVVCVVFSLAGSEVVPYDNIVAALRPKEKTDEDATGAKVSGTSGDANKPQENGTDNTTDDTLSKSPAWDPVETVRIILREVGGAKGDENEVADTSKGEASTEAVVSTSPPCSRFILRMIPIQATVSYFVLCYQ